MSRFGVVTEHCAIVELSRGDWAEALMVDVALSVARSRLPEQLRPCSQALSRQAEERHRCSQTLRYAAPIHGGQSLADDLSSLSCRRMFVPFRLQWS